MIADEEKLWINAAASNGLAFETFGASIHDASSGPERRPFLGKCWTERLHFNLTLRVPRAILSWFLM